MFIKIIHFIRILYKGGLIEVKQVIKKINELEQIPGDRYV